MNLLLDTTVLIDALRPRAPRRVLLAELANPGHLLTAAAVNVAEVYAGIRLDELGAAISLFAGLHCYPMTQAIARRAGQMKNDHAHSDKTFSLTDMMVAATAVEHDLSVVTDNRKDFMSHGLKLFERPKA